MSLIETLLHGRILLALALFVVISVVLEIAGHQILNSIHEVATTHWILQTILIPATRTLSLVVFILVAYPTLFGIEEAPSIGHLLDAGNLRLTNLVNIVFLLSLLLPLIPIFSRWPAFILPVQGTAAATILFGWLTAEMSKLSILHEVHYWPGWSVMAGLLVLAFLTHEIAKQVSHQLEKRVETTMGRKGSEKITYRAIVMILQAPVILLYTLSLGEQLR